MERAIRFMEGMACELQTGDRLMSTGSGIGMPALVEGVSAFDLGRKRKVILRGIGAILLRSSCAVTFARKVSAFRL